MLVTYFLSVSRVFLLSFVVTCVSWEQYVSSMGILSGYYKDNKIKWLIEDYRWVTYNSYYYLGLSFSLFPEGIFSYIYYLFNISSWLNYLFLANVLLVLFIASYLTIPLSDLQNLYLSYFFPEISNMRQKYFVYMIRYLVWSTVTYSLSSFCTSSMFLR